MKIKSNLYSRLNGFNYNTVRVIISFIHLVIWHVLQLKITKLGIDVELNDRNALVTVCFFHSLIRLE